MEVEADGVLDFIDVIKKSRNYLTQSIEEFTQDIFGFSNISDMHRDWYSLLEDEAKRYICILAPPEHGKSVTAGIIYALKRLLENPELRILNVAAVEEQANRQTLACFEYFDQYYPERRGKRRGDKWGPTMFTLDREGIYQEASYTAMGLSGSGIVGGHWDIIIADDLCTQANTRTPFQRMLTADFVRRTLIGRLAPGGRLIVIGSRWHQDDFYKLLVEKDRGDPELIELFWGPEGGVRVYKAILEWEDEPRRIPRKLSWPELTPGDGGWSLKEIQERWRFMGEINAQLQLQNNPLPTVGKMLKAEWLQTFGYSDLPEPRRLREAVIPIDPAFSTEEPGDWCAAACLVKDYTGQIFLWDVQHWHVTWTDFLTTYLEPFYNLMRAQVEKGRPDSKVAWRIIPEVNSLGGKTEFRKNMNLMRELGVLGQLPMVPVTTSKNKETRIGTRSAFFQNGTILVREDLKAPGNPFFDEWVGFPESDHDDCIDVVDFGLEYLLRSRAVQQPRSVSPRTVRSGMRDRRRLYRPGGQVEQN